MIDAIELSDKIDEHINFLNLYCKAVKENWEDFGPWVQNDMIVVSFKIRNLERCLEHLLYCYTPVEITMLERVVRELLVYDHSDSMNQVFSEIVKGKF